MLIDPCIAGFQSSKTQISTDIVLWLEMHAQPHWLEAFVQILQLPEYSIQLVCLQQLGRADVVL